MTSSIFSALRRAADRTVVDDGRRALSGAQLDTAAHHLADELARQDCRRIALYADNGISWIIADLASQLCGALLIPIPLFFSQAQVAQVLSSSGVDTLLTDQAVHNGAFAIDGLLTATQADVGNSMYEGLTLLRICPSEQPEIPAQTHKITFTSGTTGAPRGVCLATDHELNVARSLAAAIAIDQPRHLCVLPLSTLLENLAGIYAPLLAGGRVIVPPLEQVGLEGSSGINPRNLLQCISSIEPQTLILVPGLLDVLIAGVEQGWKAPASLRFIAVGGGKVSAAVIRLARQLGLPVYEGYGLSECSSVVTLNLPGNDRPGSVGRPLPHAQVAVDNGEIIVNGRQFLGYINEPQSWASVAVHTGDLGRIDDDGYVYIEGRRKNLLISSFGRNISPEWIESELLAGPVLKQVVVAGDAQPFCTALILPGSPQITDKQIGQWFAQVNSTLPDYAQVRKWARLETPLSPANGMTTDNGRLRRRAIYSHYAGLIAGLYDSSQKVANA